MSNRYPRESIEYWVFPPVAVEGTPVTSYKYAVTKGVARPTTWATPETVDGEVAFLLDGTRAPGTYKVFVRVTDDPEIPVIEAGRFTIT